MDERPADDGVMVELYTLDDPPLLLGWEYEALRATLAHFGERQARRTVAPHTPSALDLLAELARELLPHGPAPSLSDTLHALDLCVAAWQGEATPFQRVQARRLAFAHGQLLMLARALGVVME